MYIKESFDYYRGPNSSTLPIKVAGVALRAAGLYPSDEYIETISSQYGNSGITYEEYKKLCSQTLEQEKVDTAKVITSFKIFDKENNGLISTKELVQIIQSSEKLPRDEVNKIISAIDPNDSGTIDYSGLVKMMVNE